MKNISQVGKTPSNSLTHFIIILENPPICWTVFSCCTAIGLVGGFNPSEGAKSQDLAMSGIQYTRIAARSLLRVGPVLDYINKYCIVYTSNWGYISYVVWTCNISCELANNIRKIDTRKHYLLQISISLNINFLREHSEVDKRSPWYVCWVVAHSF